MRLDITKVELAIHTAGVLVMGGCFALAVTVFAEHTEIAAIVAGAGFWLYGKLGFRPAGPILDRIVATLAKREPDRVARLTSSPPGPPTAMPPAGTP